MKNVLTLIVSDMDGSADGAPEQTEILNFNNNFPLSDAIKQAKSKYCVISDGDLICDLTPEFFNELNSAGADLVAFCGGLCVKTSLLKSVPAKLCTDKFAAEAYSAFSAKSVKSSDLQPFEHARTAKAFSKEQFDGLYGVLEEFKKCKSKLNKEIYNFAFNFMCEKLISVYAYAIIALHNGLISADLIKEFDLKLKENIVLYLALEKRFTAANLSKLREKNFKCGFLTYSKLKKSL